MAIQTMTLDPNAVAYTDNEIVDKINAASNQITRASSVSSAARPIVAGEVIASFLAAGVCKSNLDDMTDTDRGYIKTNPLTGEYRVIAHKRSSDGKLVVSYDDQPIV